MAVLSRRRRGLDFWPGFVDAMAALLLVVIFMLLLFVIGQFVLSDLLSDRDRSLARLNAELATLAQTLSLEREARDRAEAEIGELTASLSRERDERKALAVVVGEIEGDLAAAREELAVARDDLRERRAEEARLVADIAALARLKAEMESEIAYLVAARDQSDEALTAEAEVSERALAQVELLNRQLSAVREQLEEVNRLLAAADEAAREKDLRIDELGRELNIALARRVHELDQYRSDFFGRLRAALGERDDVEIVGDRFVFSSEVLFPSGSDAVSAAGLAELARIAAVVRGLVDEIPGDLPWVLQVDGHTDSRPISTERFPSNWELSTARALAIVRFLRDEGIPAERLAATGYGEYHPIDPRQAAEAFARNRRIELKLTNR